MSISFLMSCGSQTDQETTSDPRELESDRQRMEVLKASADMKAIYKVVGRYMSSFGKPPNSLNDLVITTENQLDESTYFISLPLDPWGKEYFLIDQESKDKTYRVCSNGGQSLEDLCYPNLMDR